MSLPHDLASIKSAGVYRFTYDKSEITPEEEETLRLVIGYSEKGPFNTPVYIETEDDFTSIFGNISRRMERKGIFFNRLGIQCLATGPILALNLKPFNVDEDNPEQAAVYCFNASDIGDNETGHKIGYANIASTSSLTRGTAVSSIYDTNRFWKVDPERLHDIKLKGYYKYDSDSQEWSKYGVAPASTLGTDDYIRIVQTSSVEDSVTLFIRPVVPNDYYVKISDWYSEEVSEDIPPYLEPLKDHYLSEFFAQIYVFKGDMRYKSLFNYEGTLGDCRPYIFNYSETESTELVFTDADGNIYYEYDIDLDSVSYTDEDGGTVTVSYEDNDGNELTVSEDTLYYYEDTDGTQYSVTATTSDDTTTYTYTNSDGETVTLDEDEVLTTVFTYEDTEGTTVYVAEGEVKTIYTNESGDEISESDVVVSFTTDDGTEIEDASVETMNVNYLESITVQENDSLNTYDIDSDYFLSVLEENELIEASDSSDSSIDTSSLTLTDGRGLYEITSDYETAISWQPFCKVDEETGEVYSNPNYTDLYGQPADALEAMADVSTSNFIGCYEGILIPSFTDAYGTVISLDSVFNADYEFHKCMMHMDETLLDEAFDADTNANNLYDSSDSIDAPTTHSGTETYESVASLIHALISPTHMLKEGATGDEYDDYEETSWSAEGSKIYGKYMEGYTYNSISRSEKGKTLVSKIYGVLSYKGIFEALTNNVDSDYHYLVDTFQGYPGKAMKSQLAEIAQEKVNALVISNFPPIEDVIEYCGYNSYLGGFDMDEILEKTSNISMPSISQGASWIAMYTQLKISYNGSKFIIPSAGLVSNLFMTKNADRRMYDIVAGPRYGRIAETYDGSTLVGPDYNYAREDLDALEPFGVNAIIYRPHYGVYVNGNVTAKQKPKSSLSKIHVRELVTFVQDEMEKMLTGYHFELNTTTTRANIAAKADTILGLILANGGIYDYHVTCDDTNNTAEVIDNDMLILDYDIEPARGAEKMVQRLTLRKTNDIARIYAE